MNPLNSVAGAVITGVVLAIILFVGIEPNQLLHLSLARWLHILVGIMWIGLLYYFNVVQIPGLAAAAADKGGPGGAGVAKYIAPRALLWFRWSALATWLTGAWLLGQNLPKALTFQPGYLIIGIGAWLGTIMLFNVWVLIWPNQKKILGIVAASDGEKATARKIATMASRTNFVLSIPMLACMAGQSHGLPF
ncbi:MAG: urate hydroxylase PuuD [Steroidobacteraceae bacterium]